MNDTQRQIATVLIYACYNNLEDVVIMINNSDANQDIMNIWTTQLKPEFITSKQSAVEICVNYKKEHLLKYFFELVPVYNNPDLAAVVKNAVKLCTFSDQYHLIAPLLEMITPPENLHNRPLDVPAEEKTPSPLSPDSDTSCIICTRNIRNIVLLPCGHTPFCVNCCRTYVLIQDKNICPVCRRLIKQISRIFK